MVDKCMTIKDLKEIISNIPEQYLESNVMKMDVEYGRGLQEVYSIEFNLKIDERGIESYLEIN